MKKNTLHFKVATKDISEIIVPTLYKGKKISSKHSRKIIQQKNGRRDQIDGLVYLPCQMPSAKKNNSWDYVLRRPPASQKFKESQFCIETEDGGIFVQFLFEEVDWKIISSTKHFLYNHSKVRDIEGESGDMCCAGLRVDLVSSSIVHYVNNDKSFAIANSNRILKEGARNFHEIVERSICSKSFLSELNNLKKCNNVIQHGKGKKKLHPTYIFSKNLTNSMHRDSNDNSRSYALFFRDNLNSERGLTWFLFPFYGIAIECSKNTLISWDGRTQYHCSCTVEYNLYSFFTSSTKRVHQQSILNMKMNRKREKNTRNIEDGDDVYIRSGKSIRLATAEKIVNNQEQNKNLDNFEFIYRAKLKKEGAFKAQLKDIIHASDL